MLFLISFRPVAPRLRCEELDKWDHDMFVAEEQKPREDWEKEKVITLLSVVYISVHLCRISSTTKNQSEQLC